MNETEAGRIKDIIYEAMTNDFSSYPCDYDKEHECYDGPMDEDACSRCKYRRVCQVLNDYKRDDGFEEAMLSLIEEDGEVTYTDYPKTLDQVIDYLETAQNRFDFVYERNELCRDSEEIQSGVVLLDKSIRGLKKIGTTDRTPRVEEDDEPENAEAVWVNPTKDYPRSKVGIIVELDSARDRILDLCHRNNSLWHTHEINQALSMINDSIYGLQMWGGRIVSEPWSDKTPMHYRLMPEPIKCIEGWDLGYNKGNALKYLARAGRKENEPEAAALRKAIHSLEMRLEEIGEDG